MDNAFHLCQFHAEAANLHQAVAASHEIDIPVRAVAHDVSGPISGLIAFFPGKGIRHKYFLRLLRPVQIAACDLHPCDP